MSLPLPPNTCCSVSLVSQQHADHILKSRPDLQFSRIEQHVNVSLASPSVSLKVFAYSSHHIFGQFFLFMKCVGKSMGKMAMKFISKLQLGMLLKIKVFFFVLMQFFLGNALATRLVKQLPSF